KYQKQVVHTGYRLDGACGLAGEQRTNEIAHWRVEPQFHGVAISVGGSCGWTGNELEDRFGDAGAEINVRVLRPRTGAHGVHAGGDTGERRRTRGVVAAGTPVRREQIVADDGVAKGFDVRRDCDRAPHPAIHDQVVLDRLVEAFDHRACRMRPALAVGEDVVA